MQVDLYSEILTQTHWYLLAIWEMFLKLKVIALNAFCTFPPITQQCEMHANITPLLCLQASPALPTNFLFMHFVLLIATIGQYDESSGYYKESLDAIRSILGKTHPDTLI